SRRRSALSTERIRLPFLQRDPKRKFCEQARGERVSLNQLKDAGTSRMPSSVRVLIAEDEPNALAGLAELISGWGYPTETARDGLEAWEKAQVWEPAIIVTDLKMPRLDGMGLLAKLAESGGGLNSVA